MARWLRMLFITLAVLATGREQSPTPESIESKTANATGGKSESVVLLPQEQWLERNVLYILDGSGSMNNAECSNGRSKLDVAKEAVMASATKMMDRANVGLVVFNGEWGDPRMAIPLSRDKTLVSTFLKSFFSGGKTPLWASIRMAHKSLAARMEMQSGYGQYHIVVVTDGAATDENESALREGVKALATESAVKISVIGFCLDSHALNIAGYTQYATASDPSSLRKSLEDSLAELPSFDPKEFCQ